MIMIADLASQTLINRETREVALKLCTINFENDYSDLQRLNYYSAIWLYQAKGSLKVDIYGHKLVGDAIYFFSPYQPFQFRHEQDPTGIALHFHPDFFCIEKHKAEVACNGVLFNNIYQPPSINITKKDGILLSDILQKFLGEMNSPEIAQYELLISYLKIFLINASRIKIDQTPQALKNISTADEPFVLQKLKDLIERNFREKHTPSEFAELLSITPKALGKLTKSHFNKTPSELIHEWIIIEAKRELYLTHKTVKAIAYELGFDDEFYFSRFFKNNTEVSPQIYREKVGADRGSNFSMK
jgi:AraC family transcriptional regulator, transcriptional activator of pobA